MWAIIANISQLSQVGRWQHEPGIRFFQQVVVSEGCVIAVRGYTEIPFDSHEIADMRVNHKRWNFRDPRRPKARAASA